MRTLSLFIALFLCVNLSYGQKRKVTTAYSYLTQEKLDKAKETIDEAVQHEDCKGFAKAHLVRGQIYQAIFEGKDTNFRDQNPDALNIAWSEYQEAMKLDDKNKLEKELQPQIQNLAVDFTNQAIMEHNKDRFEASLNSFKKVLEVHASKYGSQKVDTLVIHYAGISAQRAGLLDEALDFYKKSLSLGHDPGKTYAVIISILFNQSREAEAAGNEALTKSKKEEAVKFLLQGIEQFPDDEYMLVEVINYYLLGDNPADAEQYLDKAIAKNPVNVDQLYRAKGTLYEKMNRPEDAEKMYLKTLELAPNDFHSYYQIGNIHLDRVIKEHEKVNGIDDVKEYNKEFERVMKLYESVIPYFEKALEIDPDSDNAKTTLSRLYFQLRTRPNSDYQKKYDNIQKELQK